MTTIVLPRDVKDKIEAAKKLEAEVFKTDVTAPVEEPTPAPAVAPAEPTPEPVASAPEPTPAPEPVSAETISKAEFDKLAHRFDVVQGMHRADSKKFRDTIDQLLERNEKLLAEVQDLRTNRSITVQTPDPAPLDTPPVLGESAKMIQEKYPDLFNAIHEIVTTNSPKSEDKGELAEQVNFIMNDLATKSQRDFYGFLDSKAGDWRTVNDSPEFVGWLQTTDPFTGHSLHELLLDAYNKMDAPRVKAFFDRYAKESASTVSTTPVPAAPAAVTPTSPAAPARPTKESLVTPAPTAVTPAPSGGEGKTTYTAKQINDHYRNRATGKLKLSAADAKKWDDEFFNAGKENRIVG